MDRKELGITGREITVSAILDRMKYTIDYYQREYTWQARNIIELMGDLESKFLSYYDDKHERTQVEAYGSYFLGSIVISRKNGKNFIIDGQQRLTSLTLLLIYLHNLQQGRADNVDVRNLVFSTRFGKKTFNLIIPERTACMEALFSGTPYHTDSETDESVRNIVARYADIEEHFPETLKDESLPYFIDWLLENVYLVRITAYSDEDAYIIFETMNDRGVSLSPTDMLKGYLLSNITNNEQRDAAHVTWRNQILSLLAVGKDAESDFFKTWLRAKYAKTIRERKRGVVDPQNWTTLKVQVQSVQEGGITNDKATSVYT